MMNGKVYKRTFNNDTNIFLLKSIRNDYGEDAFKRALNAAQEHVNYYSTLGHGDLVGLQALINKMRD